MPSIFFFFENDIFTLSPSSSSSNYKIAIVINTLTTMNNQFEALNAPKIDLLFFFLHSYELNTTSLSLSLHIKAKKTQDFDSTFFIIHKVKEANNYGSVRPDNLQAVDDLPRSRLVNADVIFAIDFEICFLRRLKVKSSDFPDDLQFSHPPDDLHVSRPRFYSEILVKPRSPDDFQEVQTTSRKS
ncbi:hypothetical protein IGI04_030144 [Brassica rapa subsp. trilocularis]|uniref:Uncharacterized protein n=1 Tax=Brassica rapa subsp. trilocularis TaxID=1813537 RepID=A0ABQ7LSL9_BRACM|nr:hypothetical protein IGI04_030144 [Brassica rapa subsp. trilocularis]